MGVIINVEDKEDSVLNVGVLNALAEEIIVAEADPVPPPNCCVDVKNSEFVRSALCVSAILLTANCVSEIFALGDIAAVRDGVGLTDDVADFSEEKDAQFVLDRDAAVVDDAGVEKDAWMAVREAADVTDILVSADLDNVAIAETLFVDVGETVDDGVRVLVPEKEREGVGVGEGVLEGVGAMQEITFTEPGGPFALATVLLPINEPTVEVTPKAVLIYELPPPPLP